MFYPQTYCCIAVSHTVALRAHTRSLDLTADCAINSHFYSIISVQGSILARCMDSHAFMCASLAYFVRLIAL